jgi:hypothetical protein
MIDVIHKATMADSWKAEVEKQMEGQKEIIPLLLSGFYTLAPTGFDFGYEACGSYQERTARLGRSGSKQ